MLINKFQRRQEKVKESEEWAWRMKDIGDVRSSSTARKKGSSCRQQKTIQSAMGLTIMATHPKGFALMTEYPQPRITMDSIIKRSRFTISWGQGQCSWSARRPSQWRVKQSARRDGRFSGPWWGHHVPSSWTLTHITTGWWRIKPNT
jgi:hypothetical protein